MTTMTAQTTQVYSVFIRATPEQIWEAITKPEWTARYFYGARIEVGPEWRKVYSPDGGDDWGSTTVQEFDPPHRLVHEWKSSYNPELMVEEPSRVSWEIEPQEDGTTLLTVVHDRLEGAPKTAESVSGTGWMYVLSGLKTLLETGEPRSPAEPRSTSAAAGSDEFRAAAPSVSQRSPDRRHSRESRER